MTIADMMKNFAIIPGYKGPLSADTDVIGVDISESKDAAVDTYVVARDGVTTYTGALNPVVESKAYFSGARDVRTGTKRTFTIPGDVIEGDAFIDFCLDYKMKYGTGSTVDVPYVYFNHITGKGEKGMATISVTEDAGGNAQASKTFSITITAIGTPDEYTYTPTP